MSSREFCGSSLSSFSRARSCYVLYDCESQLTGCITLFYFTDMISTFRAFVQCLLQSRFLNEAMMCTRTSLRRHLLFVSRLLGILHLGQNLEPEIAVWKNLRSEMFILTLSQYNFLKSSQIEPEQRSSSSLRTKRWAQDALVTNPFGDWFLKFM